MTPEDQKSREEFEALASDILPGIKFTRCRHNPELYAEIALEVRWQGFILGRRTYRATVLEDAAKVAEGNIGSGALAPLEEYRAGFIADAIRALAGGTREE